MYQALIAAQPVVILPAVVRGRHVFKG